MSLWSWDPFEATLPKLFITLGQSEHLPEDINEFNLMRERDHKLTLTTKSPAGFKRPQEESMPGKVYKNENYVTLKSPCGTGKLNGISHSYSETNLLGATKDSVTDSYEIQSFEFFYKAERSIAHTIDYVANIPNNYIWPSFFDEEVVDEKSRTFPGDPPIRFQVKSKRSGSSRKCLRFKLNEYDIVFGINEQGDIEAERPGYILYTGSPDDITRRRIRDCLSFAFGLPLIHFGHACYCGEGKLTELVAITPQTVNGRAWDIVGTPPAPITEHGGTTNILSVNLIERVIQGLFVHMSKYNLEVLPWRLWYAETSPYFMRPAYYGALIEGIQKSYTSDKNNKVCRTIINKSNYRVARKCLESYLDGLDIDEPSRLLFIDKLNNGNVAPQKIIAQRFYSSLNLTLGDLEISAWNNRNDAAHGNEIAEEKITTFIRETKVLRVMLNRIVLRITNGSDAYFDYFTCNYPIRQLSDAIPTQDPHLAQ